MPSQRKRIGYLPRPDVQKILDKICRENKLSQSKVTGILVEEALSSRGIINTANNKDLIINKNEKLKNFLVEEENFTKFSDNNFMNTSLSEEIIMINDFIEYKVFKKLMNKNYQNPD